jgi:hypothetical protein
VVYRYHEIPVVPPSRAVRFTLTSPAGEPVASLRAWAAARGVPLHRLADEKTSARAPSVLLARLLLPSPRGLRTIDLLLHPERGPGAPGPLSPAAGAQVPAAVEPPRVRALIRRADGREVEISPTKDDQGIVDQLLVVPKDLVDAKGLKLEVRVAKTSPATQTWCLGPATVWRLPAGVPVSRVEFTDKRLWGKLDGDRRTAGAVVSSVECFHTAVPAGVGEEAVVAELQLGGGTLLDAWRTPGREVFVRPFEWQQGVRRVLLARLSLPPSTWLDLVAEAPDAPPSPAPVAPATAPPSPPPSAPPAAPERLRVLVRRKGETKAEEHFVAGDDAILTPEFADVQEVRVELPTDPAKARTVLVGPWAYWAAAAPVAERTTVPGAGVVRLEAAGKGTPEEPFVVREVQLPAGTSGPRTLSFDLSPGVVGDLGPALHKKGDLRAYLPAEDWPARGGAVRLLAWIRLSDGRVVRVLWKG